METKIKELREHAGMSQMDLAAKVGVVQSVVSDWERGVHLPRTGMIPQLAHALGCRISDLFVQSEEGRDPA